MFRVLILDDDPLFCKTLVRNLERNTTFPCAVASATTAEAVRAMVRQAETPFDVFLIDQRLGPGPDGITVLQELLAISPRSEAIVFTMANDVEAGMRAYRAGAYRYLHKPFEPQELLLILRLLHEWRHTRRERDNLKALTEIAEQAQRVLTVPELGEIIVRGGCRFGFERARLWLLGPDGTTLVGISQRGNQGLDGFAGFRLVIADSVYTSRAFASREPIVFQGHDLGKSYLYRHFGDSGFRPAEGEWCGLPLWIADRCLGVLMLDNYEKPRDITPEQIQELTLLGQQVAAALERVQLYEQEQYKSVELARKSRELERKNLELGVLSEMGRLVTNRAAIADLDTLLRHVHELIGQILDARNFMIVLHDTTNGQLDIRLNIKDKRRQRRHRRPASAGLEGYVIQHNRPLLLLGDNSAFRKLYHIRQIGPAARCWLGVPLQVEGVAIGAMVVQSYVNAEAYTYQDQRLLELIVGQMAGAIETARLKDDAARKIRRLAVLQYAGEELMKLAEQKTEWLWHAALTIATADFGLGFNRAMLFLIEDGGAVLRGHVGIGEFTSRLAHRIWERLKKGQFAFEDYLNLLTSGQIPATDIDHVVRDLMIHLPSDRSTLHTVLQEKRRLVIPRKDVAHRMPQRFVETFGEHEYAVLPLLVGAKRIGVVVVDNCHNHEPLQPMLLNQLENWLTQVALVYENQRQRRASDTLIEVNHTVLARVASQPLSQTLQEICGAAQALTEADSVIIYPLLKDAAADLCYDSANTGYVGLQHDLSLHDKPSRGGVTFQVLQSGRPMIIYDVKDTDWFDDQCDVRTSFLLREQIRAFVAVPIHDIATGEFQGVLYVNFRMPQAFTPQDVRRAQSFAELAGAAIRTSRTGEHVRRRRDAAELESQKRRRELELLRSVLEQALKSNADTEQIKKQLIRVLLRTVQELLPQPNLRAGLFLCQWEQPIHDEEPQEMRRQYFLIDGHLDEDSEPQLLRGITGRAFRTSTDQYAPDITQPPWNELFYSEFSLETRSELAVLIRLEGRKIGLFNIESPDVDAFTREQHRTLQRLAAAAALALDNVRRQENLRNVLDVAEKVIRPSELNETLEAVLEAAQRVAQGVSAVTIWYKDPERGQIVPGPSFGVLDKHSMYQTELKSDDVLSRVMRSEKPIWATHAQQAEVLSNRFVVSERIRSAAAFPLRASDALEEAVGAIFFNYRQHHIFTREERTLFPILATIAATSVRDALRLEALKKERRRLSASMEITRAVGATVNLEPTLQGILETLSKLFPATRLCVMTYDMKKHTLTFASASKKFYPLENLAPVTSLDVFGNKSIACRVARKALQLRQDILENIGDVAKDPNYLVVSPTTRSELCLALMDSKRELLGVLMLESEELDAFGMDDQALLRGVGQSISIAIERAYINAELRFNASIATATAWVAEIAHDIKREIGAIRQSAYMTKMYLADAHQQYITAIDESAGRLAAYAQAPRSTEAVELRLDALLATKVQEIITQRGAEVDCRFDLACPQLRVQASPVLLERVLRHLLRNALEAMAETMCEKKLTVRTLRKDRMAEVQISNTGPDVRNDIRQRLFFEQVSSKGTSRSGDEGGRGLLFVRWAVEAMGGQVELLSKPGEEVTFGFTLPVANIDGSKENE